MVDSSPALTPRTYADLYAFYLAAPPWIDPAKAQSTDPAPDHASGDASSIQAVAGGGSPESNGHAPGTNGKPPTDYEITTFTERQILRALQADVLGRQDDGRIKIYSEFHRRTTLLQDSAKLKFEHLLEFFGPPVKSVVSRNNEDALPGVYAISAVREAISLLGGYRMLSDDTEWGSGVWGCKSGALVLVNQNEAAEYCTCGRKLTKIIHPRHGENLLSFDTGAKPWYQFEALGPLLEKANDQAWREQVVNDLYDLWGRWRWQGENDKLILTGLVLSTWVQSVWEWRPRVEIIGASNTGKSMFCLTLAGLFDKLSLLTSDTTAAGLRQEICNRMVAVVVDEVDASDEAKAKEQKKILTMVRTATRGGITLRGTGAQKSVKTTMKHLFWLFGITIDRSSQADWNRAIGLNLLPPLQEMAGKLKLPPAAELADLGQRSLAVAVWCAMEAAMLAVRLKDTLIEDADQRQVESYSVPAAMFWIAMGQLGKPEDVLIQMMASARVDATKMETDEEALIAAILRAKVKAKGGEELSIGQAIERSQDHSNVDTERAEWKKVLEQAGVKIDVFGSSKGIPKEMAMQAAIMFSYQTVRSIPLKGTKFQDQPINQTLARIEGAKLAQRRVGGGRGHVVMLPLESFLERYAGVEEKKLEF